jgi:membrane protease YdiL (CAAX protease family)
MLKQRKYIFIAINSSLALLVFSLLLLNISMMTPVIFSHYFGPFDANKASSFAFLILFSFTCFLIIPAAASKFIFRKKLSDLGLRLPSGKAKTFGLIVIALIILAPSIYLLSKQADFKTYYTMRQPTFSKLAAMTVCFPIYYFAEEFFFRGFLFLGLWHKVKWHSFWMTEIIFTFSHIGKPGLEILLCVPASVVFNCLTLYTKSFYPAFIVHSTIGIFCIYLVNYGHIGIS